MDLLFVDLELGRDGRFHRLAALRGTRVLEARGRSALDELAAFARGADAVAGHNIEAHDVPWLARAGHPVADLPTLDTLLLSPLAWPERPYHRLVKLNTELLRDGKPNPLDDCTRARTLLGEAMVVFDALQDSHPALHALLSWTLVRHGSAYRFVFDAAPDRPPTAALRRELAGRACTDALAGFDPVADPMPATWLAAWLRAAPGTGSVLPPWVRRRFPAVLGMARALLDNNCGGCAWCRAQHDPQALLERFFGFPSFRPDPAAPDGSSLQQRIVECGLQGQPVYAVLPTGGGKSICFQLPGIANHRRSGRLTVVLSPLQSLMKDQVDNLTPHTACATAISGAITPLERRQRLEAVTQGNVDLLYLSPEQLRNRSVRRALLTREIAAWVFDEAHCLSKWGHDFRTDYQYAPRFIRELAHDQGLPAPPVHCFTATSQQAVTQEIRGIFRAELGQELALLDGGSTRDNLTFSVEQVPKPRKPDRVHEILCDHLPPDQAGAGVVFCGSRKGTEQLAGHLANCGWSVAAYHAGLDNAARKSTQSDFLGGRFQVICATSAFGMGVDKPDVRVVVHHDIPGSLESYLQQAGRAGRDRKPAHCVLLFTPADVERQFSMSARNELSVDDLRALWKTIRRVPARREGDLEQRIISPAELLASDIRSGAFDPDDAMATTRVLTGVSWLERAGLLQRDENRTRVFSGRPRFKTLAEAKERIAALDLSPPAVKIWTSLYNRLLQTNPDQGLDATDLAVIAETLHKGVSPQQATRKLFTTLHEMTQARLLQDGMELTAFVRHKVQSPSHARLNRLLAVDHALMEVLPEHHPDEAQPAEAGLTRIAMDVELDDPVSVSEVRGALWAFRRDGLGLDPAPAGAEVRSLGPGKLRLSLRRSWSDLRRIRRERRQAAQIVLAAISSRIPYSQGPGKDVLVPFSLEDLASALEAQRIGLPSMKSSVQLAENALLMLHDGHVIVLQSGLAVFRPAMTLRRAPDGPTALDTAQVAPLQEHYAQRRVQIHVMHAYASEGEAAIDRAQALAADWFTLDRAPFLARWLPDRKLDTATSPQTWTRIVDGLGNRVQQEIVTASPRRNQLVLAGPGSGKTRVLVHRVAFLLMAERVPARGILVVCYTRANAIELKRRLRALCGEFAYGVRVHTLHGVALRMTGRRPDAVGDFKDLLVDATALLEGRKAPAHLEPDEVRSQLLHGYQHILVDEYQDVSADQYALIRALAQRGSSKIKLFAVGDDDQNIFAWNGAETEFLRRFATEYKATQRELVDCYRCARSILAVASTVVSKLDGRLKHAPLRAMRDVQGQVTRIRGTELGLARAVAEHIQRLVAQGAEPASIAVLSRSRTALGGVRPHLVRAGVRFRWPLTNQVPIAQVREVRTVLDGLALARGRTLNRHDLEGLLLPGPAGCPWRAFLQAQFAEWLTQADVVLAGDAERWLWEAASTERRAAAFGDGVGFRTLHGAKGLEFDHVIVLDDGDRRDAPDELRRLHYVGITRARDSLLLAVRTGRAPCALDDPDVPTTDVGGAPGQAPAVYGAVTLDDLWLDWAGRQAPRAPAHRALEDLRYNHPVRLVEQGRFVAVVDRAGTQVAALSAGGKARLSGLRGLQLRVLATVVRTGAQSGEEYQDRLAVDRWLVPVLEACWER